MKSNGTFTTDIDGVLADFVGCYLATLEDLFGIKHTPDEVDNWLFTECLGITKEQDEAIWHSELLTHYMRNAALFSKGAELVHQAAAEGKDILYVTARGMISYEEGQREERHDLTLDWLPAVGLPDGETIFALDKLPILRKYNSSKMVEDSPSTVMKLAEAGINVTVPKWKYNDHLVHPNINFVDNWR